MIRNPRHTVTLARLTSPGVYEDVREVPAIVSPISAQERHSDWGTSNTVTISVRVDDYEGDPPVTADWIVRVTEPAHVAGGHAVVGVLPYEGHLRLICTAVAPA